MKNYDTALDAIQDLNKRGYTANLSLEGETIDDKAQNIKMTADDIKIDEFYRFEGISNPDDMSIVYAVTSDKYGVKGVLMNAFGTYANTSSSAIEAKLNHQQAKGDI